MKLTSMLAAALFLTAGAAFAGPLYGSVDHLNGDFNTSPPGMGG